MTSTYILVDTLLIGEVRARPWKKKKNRPSWMARIYERSAADVSPVLIDIEAAQRAGRMDDVMEIVNSQHPQLGVSFIDTMLPLNDLADHLRQLIYICTEKDTQLTLRFADCTMLPALAKIATPEQWAAISHSMHSWKVHTHCSRLVAITVQNLVPPATFPLRFSDAQIAALKEELGAYELLRNLRIMRPAQATKYNTIQSYEIARKSRSIWRAAGHPDCTDLTLFASKVFDTNGRLLGVPTLEGILAQTDMSKIREGIRRLASFQY